MKKNLIPFGCFIFYVLCFADKTFAQKARPDTVHTGIYINSIYDIDFKQKEYTVDFWLWLKYKNKAFDFLQNLEIPQAKKVTKSFSTVDSWKIGNFPFDRQKLRLTLENSQYTSDSLVFAVDTVGKQYDPRFTLNGWNVDSFSVTIGKKAYETAFGDPVLTKPHSEYSSFKVKADITREAMGLFWKLFLGMYVAFLIAYVCFYIHADGIDSRFGLSVGSLFAVIGNKYIVDSSLPESTSFTLVDTLHGITLFVIIAVITCTAYSLKLVKQNKAEKAHKFDMLAAQIILVTYVILNIWFISRANMG